MQDSTSFKDKSITDSQNAFQNESVPLQIAIGCIAPRPLEKRGNEKILAFEQRWKPVSLLRPHHKTPLKEYISYKQGRDGTNALCENCLTLYPISQLQIHHVDHNRTNNLLSNLKAYCEPCNNEERKIWLAASYTERRSGDHPTKEKERSTDNELLQKSKQKQDDDNAPPTFRAGKKYRIQALAYMIQYIRDNVGKEFDVVVADIEAKTGCSHAKAIEYANSFSQSTFAPFQQYFSKAVFDTYGKLSIPAGMWIKVRQNWDARDATEEYHAATKIVEQKTKGESNGKGSI